MVGFGYKAECMRVFCFHTRKRAAERGVFVKSKTFRTKEPHLVPVLQRHLYEVNHAWSVSVDKL